MNSTHDLVVIENRLAPSLVAAAISTAFRATRPKQAIDVVMLPALAIRTRAEARLAIYKGRAVGMTGPT